MKASKALSLRARRSSSSARMRLLRHPVSRCGREESKRRRARPARMSGDRPSNPNALIGMQLMAYAGRSSKEAIVVPGMTASPGKLSNRPLTRWLPEVPCSSPARCHSLRCGLSGCGRDRRDVFVSVEGLRRSPLHSGQAYPHPRTYRRITEGVRETGDLARRSR